MSALKFSVLNCLKFLTVMTVGGGLFRCKEWSAFVFTLQETVRSPRLLLYRSQLIKKLAHANNKVSTLISNRATSVKVTRK